MSVRADAARMADELIQLRRRLHATPEIGFDLPRTQAIVLEALDGLPLEIRTGKHLSSVTAVLHGARCGPLVLLRGDMDGLPLHERTGLDYASDNGAMHACGHDLHAAGLLGAARLLCARREKLAGDVLFMFQPGEEGMDGAGAMLREGLLDVAGRRPDAAYGLHVSASHLPPGVFAGRPGALMSASADLRVRVIGAGGHGSAPHRANDPIPAACEMVLALQTAVTRRFDVFDPVVITVGQIHAGTKSNVIPDEAAFEATVRSFSTGAADRVRQVTVDVCEQIACAHGLDVKAEFVEGYPVTVNDASEHDFLAATARDVFGEQRYQPMPNPTSGSEDFSRILAEIPGAYVFLGACPSEDVDAAPYNHSSTAVFDDRYLPDAATLLTELAIRRMNRGER